MNDVVLYDEGAQKYILVEWLARTRLDPSLKGGDEPFLDLDRFPKDLHDLSLKFGLAYQKITRWVSSKEISDAVSSRVRQISAGHLVQHLGSMNDVLIGLALGGSIRAMELFYNRLDKDLYQSNGSFIQDGEKASKTEINVFLKQIIEKRKSGDASLKWQEDVEEASWKEV